jgi:hypothetical protein
MAEGKINENRWLSDAEEHNYTAAESYLRLLYREDRVAEMVARFRRTALVQFKAKDIFRASPLCLLRDEQSSKVVIADGYHRLCALYEFNEDAWIPCKII